MLPVFPGGGGGVYFHIKAVRVCRYVRGIAAAPTFFFLVLLALNAHTFFMHVPGGLQFLIFCVAPVH